MCILTDLDSAGPFLYAVRSAFGEREADIMCPAALKIILTALEQQSSLGRYIGLAITDHSANQRSEGRSASDPVFVRGSRSSAGRNNIAIYLIASLLAAILLSAIF